jgi:hypothetical protein
MARGFIGLPPCVTKRLKVEAFRLFVATRCNKLMHYLLVGRQLSESVICWRITFRCGKPAKWLLTVGQLACARESCASDYYSCLLGWWVPPSLRIDSFAHSLNRACRGVIPYTDLKSRSKLLKSL